MVQIVTLNNRQAWAVDDSGGRGREVLKRWEKLGNPTAAVSSSAPLRISSLGEIQSGRRETSFSIIVSEVFCKKQCMNELPGGSKEVELQ